MLEMKLSRKIFIILLAAIFVLMTCLSISTSNTSDVVFYKFKPFNIIYGRSDIWTYEFLTLPFSPCICQEQIIVLVHTAPSNFKKRAAIRSTWKEDADERNIKVFFTLGIFNEELKRNLTDEMLEFQDFIQGNFMDAYHNLTYKHLMNFEYINKYCSNIKYLVKVDDDTFIDVSTLKKFIDIYSNQYGNSSNILCRTATNATVMRTGKWNISEEEYADTNYPVYCYGFAIIYPKATISLLYAVSNKMKQFWIDDVFVTGMLAREANINHTDISKLVLYDNDGSKPFIFGKYDMTEDEIETLWNFTRYHPQNLKKQDLLDIIE